MFKFAIALQLAIATCEIKISFAGDQNSFFLNIKLNSEEM